jgi:hypothetical protein
MNTKPLISPITAPPVFLIGVLASHILNAALMLCKPFKRVLKNDSKAQGSCELIEILKVCFKSKATPAMVTQSQLAFAFGIIFVAVLAVKKTMYQLINIPSGINPCTLNKTFALCLRMILQDFIMHYSSTLSASATM